MVCVKEQKTMKRKWMGIAGVLIIVALIAGIWFYVDSLAYDVCRVEAGVEIVPSDFLKKPDETACFTEESEKFDIRIPGEYQVKVKSGLFTHSATLIIEDTQKPQAKVQEVQLSLGEVCSAQDFIVNVTDETEVKVIFVEEPDFSQIGQQQVQIHLVDLGDNVLTISADLLISPVKELLVLEAGEEAPVVSDFLIQQMEAKLLTDISTLDLNRIAEYDVSVQVGEGQYTSQMQVKDTIAPEATLQSLADFTLVPKTAEDFVTEIVDVTQVSVEFVQEPDLTLPGVQTVEIRITDEAGNAVIEQTELTLTEDVEAPVLVGVKDILIYMGDAISYRKGVSATDNCEEGVSLEIDNSKVNPNEAGSYPVTYRATDLAGNVTEEVITVTIKARTHTLGEVNVLADAVLAKIMKPEMTPIEQVRAIYDYNMSHISYINHSEKGDWIQAAYMGLAEGKGDCYIYACTAKLLLTRAGITNMDIAKIPAKTSHYWNLVDIGDGWYHFDTTPRKDHPTIFMWTDEQMMEYSAKHNKSHNYDPTQYPEIN